MAYFNDGILGGEQCHEISAIPKPIQYNEEATIYPSTQEHRQTFTILYGRGSWAKKFGASFLASTKLQQEFPQAKIIFLTAPQTRASTYDDLKVHQWFHTWHLTTDNEERTDNETPMAGGYGQATSSFATYQYKKSK